MICDMAELVLIIPMLTRAHRVAPLIASIEENTDCEHTVLFVCTRGDVYVLAAVGDAMRSRPHLRCEILDANTVGDYAIKINHGYRVTDEPFMFLGADDLQFHADWWPKARRHFDNDMVGVVGTQDQCNDRVKRGTHSTHPVVARTYVDAHGTIDGPGVLHEGYVHEFVDDEFIQTAKRRRVFAFEHGSVVEHLHPMANKAPLDHMYAAQGSRMMIDRQTFQSRQHLWAR